MSKLVVAAVAIAVLGFLAYRAMYGRAAPVEAEAPVEAPTDKLKGAREAAKRIEDEQGRRADDALEHATDRQ